MEPGFGLALTRLKSPLDNRDSYKLYKSVNRL